MVQVCSTNRCAFRCLSGHLCRYLDLRSLRLFKRAAACCFLFIMSSSRRPPRTFSSLSRYSAPLCCSSMASYSIFKAPFFSRTCSTCSRSSRRASKAPASRRSFSSSLLEVRVRESNAACCSIGRDKR